ncbi:MAG TPA: thiolase family protein [Candidatus Dormibacteraeota bacterium]|nr:thiolase family protein [Candidatus Dormibacteraeota bacterium]
MRGVVIRGAAMTPFGKHPERSGRELVEEALGAALADARLQVGDVQAAYVGNAASGLMSGQESIRAQVVLRRTGLMGVPMVSVENACASSSSALHLGWQAVAGGMYDCVAVVGYEKLYDADRARAVQALNASMDLTELSDIFNRGAGPERAIFMDLFGAWSDGQGRDRFDPQALALVSVKSHRNGSLNPCAQYQRELTVEQVLGSRQVAGPLTVLMCAALSDGAACLVLCAPGFRGSRGKGVKIAASVMVSGRGDDLGQPTAVQRAIRDAEAAAGAGLEDVDVIELHDATSIAELDLYGQLGLCGEGEAETLVRDRVTWLGGKLPVNPSGGMISRGHPMGATGAAQVVELTWQLQGRCGSRQVPSARLALAQNYGGWVGTDAAVCCVHMLQR